MDWGIKSGVEFLVGYLKFLQNVLLNAKTLSAQKAFKSNSHVLNMT